MRCLLPLFTLFGCVGDPETRPCLEYGTYTYMHEKCIPNYGMLICAEEEVTKVYCKLYDDEEDNGNN